MKFRPWQPLLDGMLARVWIVDPIGFHVVAANQARIRKRCWQSALDSAGPNATGNARVQGKIVIGPSGAVQSATASGAERDYPGLSSCIAGQMQGWKFPPSSGSTPVNVPFVFAGQ